MGFFSPKKKEVGSFGAASLPRPDFPDLDDSKMPQFPVYEPSFGDIKNEVSGTVSSFPEPQSLNIPVRRPELRPKVAPVPVTPPVEEESFGGARSEAVSSGKPLFVKIEKYKDALSAMDVLKKKLADVEHVLAEIDKVREDEDKVLDQWKSDVSKIKEKLIDLDSDLFEV